MTTLFGNYESVELKAIAEPKAKKHGWLPVLTVLFMISYGLMTMLIVEQGQTIESQRALIRELFRDSTELSAVKKMQVQERNQTLAQNPSTQAQNPGTQIPSVQIPSTQGPQAQLKHAPSSQQRADSQLKPKGQFQMPSKPASDLADSRRALITI
ncbi:MAG TPA: hypothetical protein VGS27_35870 [Candidatus Sulfotelmatobacter sp.]|nr:hypothetical protein [Candidatus Sulfotelmatobacter sp.]